MKMVKRNRVKEILLLALALIVIVGIVKISNSNICNPDALIPVENSVDVIVAGGGSAGVAAAVSAGRSGAKVLLIEQKGSLGGVMTSGLLTYFLDYENKSGLMLEIIEKLEAVNSQIHPQTFDPEEMKYLLEQLCVESNVQILYHTRVVAANVDSRIIKSVITENTNGRQAWGAKMFIDCTGNGDLAAMAGCSYDLGNPLDSGAMQAGSLVISVTGLDYNDMLTNNFLVHSTIPYSNQNKINFYNEIVRGGVFPSYTKPVLSPIRKDLYNVGINHQYDFDPFDAANVTQATIEARDEVHRIVNGLRSLGGIWRNIRIVDTPEQIGIREGRRIKGLYTICRKDLINGARFPDAVVRATFPVDIHYGDKSRGGAYDDGGVKVQPYDIPVRSLIAKDVDNLMMAGRCISGDFFAHASYRVLGNAIPMGEAAGKYMVEAISKKILPKDLVPNYQYYMSNKLSI